MVGTTDLSSERYHLVVGLDYGTTFSGISFALSYHNTPDAIHNLTQWPAGRYTETGLKTPSQIAYASENPGHYANTWGYEIEPGMKRYSWMKLLLDANSKPTEWDDPDLAREIQKVRMPRGKGAEDVTGDYLRELHGFVMGVLGRRFGDVLRTTKIRFWLTKPAIWGDEAQVKTLEAARRAGFGARKGDELALLTEPEAAAYATLMDTGFEWESRPKVGDSVLVVDCGGGTVDITAYVIARVEPRVELYESCVGIGGKCGSTSVDRNLLKLMHERFGEHFDNLKLEATAQGSKFMMQFEYNKKIFGGLKKLRRMQLYMNADDSEYYDIVDGEVILTEEDMRTLFKPVVEKILKLVKKQVREVERSGETPVNKLMLVGGFGDSPHLRKELQTYCDSQGIMLSVPDSSWGAVARGAVVRGLELATVEKRRCRRHYGVRCTQTFGPNDKEEDAMVCEFTGRKFAKGYMSWSIHKGGEIVADTSTSVSFYRVLRAGDKKFETHLYSCNLDEAPERYSDKDVESVGRIETDLSNVDMSQFESKQDKYGRKIIKLDYDIEVVLGDQQGTILFRTKVGDTVIGQTSVKFSRG